MHGLINRSIQCFVRDTYGSDSWLQVANACGVPPDGFEPMLAYKPEVTDLLLGAIAEKLGKSTEEVLDDIGTYLVSHPNTQAVRRLLRFGGDTFTEFLMSLDDLPDRARLAVSELDFPELTLNENGGGLYTLRVAGVHPGFAPVLLGILRALADDYGALVLLDWTDHSREGAPLAEISISLLDTDFAEGRDFLLGGGDQPKEGAA